MKKRSASLLIIEGLWRIGKTNLLNYLSKNKKYIKIKEPNHLNYCIGKNIDEWYIDRHHKRFEQAKNHLRNAKKVIMERSILSSVAYEFAKYGKLSEKFDEELNKIKEVDDLMIVFLYSKREFAIKNLKKIKDKEIKNSFVIDNKFYNRYMLFYEKILKKSLGDKLIILNVTENKRFISLGKIISKLTRRINFN